jgi:hypothetical protein
LAPPSRIERILLLADKQSTAPITSHGPSAIQADVPFETQGLLLVSIASLRDVAKREFQRREATRKAVRPLSQLLLTSCTSELLGH